jgi:hypothetical protein
MRTHPSVAQMHRSFGVNLQKPSLVECRCYARDSNLELPAQLRLKGLKVLLRNGDLNSLVAIVADGE